MAEDSGAAAAVRKAISHRQTLSQRMAREVAGGTSCLAVIAAGMGGEALLAELCATHCRRGDSTGPLPLVLVVNSGCETDGAAEAALTVTHGVPPEGLPRRLHTDVAPRERALAYEAGGVCSVDARHLCVDLLQQRVDPSRTAGVIVWDAHEIESADHPAAFALRLLRRAAAAPALEGAESAAEAAAAAAARQPWVRAVSDDPAAFIKRRLGLSALLRNLGVSRVLLWPRFHVGARHVLDRAPVGVVEVQQGMPDSVSGLQSALLGAAGELCAELRAQLGPLLAPGAGTDELSAQGFAAGLLFRWLRCELRGSWDQVPPSALRLVDELSELRQLLQRLHSESCVDFLAAVDAATVRGRGGAAHPPDAWLLTAAASRLLPAARQRVWTIAAQPGIKRAHDGTAASGVVPVLEGCSRLAALRGVLADVRADWAASGGDMTTQAPGATVDAGRRRPVCLVLVRDHRTRCRVAQALPGGGERRALRRQLKRYLYRGLCTAEGVPGLPRAEASSLYCQLSNATEAPTPATAKRGSPAPEAARRPAAGDSRASLAAAAAGGRQAAAGEVTGAASPEQLGEGADALLAAAAAEAAEEEPASDDDISSEAGSAGAEDSEPGSDEDAPLPTQLVPPSTPVPPPQPAGQQPASARPGSGEAARARLRAELKAHWRVHGSGPCIVVHLIRAAAGLLERLWPSWVVLFDPAVEAVRRVECFVTGRGKGWPIKVYNLGHSDSTDRQRALTDLRLEKNAFEHLIHARESVAAHDVTEDLVADDSFAPQRKSARQGGLSERLRRGAPPRRVVCDLREFRSALPSALHRSAERLVPSAAHLDVADYVLAPDAAVERKSVADLLGSLMSGRLLQQTERLCRHYATPMLLIEFDPQRPFSLDAHLLAAGEGRWGSRMSTLVQEANRDSRRRGVLRQLTHLTTLHPTLRILWSRGPVMSSRLFAAAKRGRAEPAAEGQRGETEGDVAAAARTLLHRLPGVTEAGAAALAQRFGTLGQIAAQPLPLLQAVLGVERGTELHTFLNEGDT
eukprot:TRINITY_DN16215_c0_g1_i1.p1 TRINITY_DN16215_c0_g1~~TRINITY_DN16215_c0_g1_i1.p1  ORF type:complete len:1051 (+),score=180.75 TRINITY_DN16215_c0_g1_i1:70-3153(+)